MIQEVTRCITLVTCKTWPAIPGNTVDSCNQLVQNIKSLTSKFMSRSIWKLSKSPIDSWVSAVNKKAPHQSGLSIRSAMPGPGSNYLKRRG